MAGCRRKRGMRLMGWPRRGLCRGRQGPGFLRIRRLLADKPTTSPLALVSSSPPSTSHAVTPIVPTLAETPFYNPKNNLTSGACRASQTGAYCLFASVMHCLTRQVRRPDADCRRQVARSGRRQSETPPQRCCPQAGPPPEGAGLFRHSGPAVAKDADKDRKKHVWDERLEHLGEAEEKVGALNDLIQHIRPARYKSRA